jgi:adenylate cyclase class 2
LKPEIEAKFLAVNHSELREKLQALGAVQKAELRLMRRKNYDYPDLRLDKEKNGWVRVRDEGNKVTLSYKQLNSRELDGTLEVNVTVDSFASTCSFLEQIGLESKTFQESKRESWQLEGCEIELDEWPWVKPYVEIEGPDETSVRKAAAALGLDWTQAVHGSVEVVYKNEYDVTDEEVDYIPEIRFDAPVPDLLEEKRI